MFNFLSQYQQELQDLFYNNDYHENDVQINILVDKAYSDFHLRFAVQDPKVRTEYVRMLCRVADTWDHMGYMFLLKYSQETLSFMLEEFKDVKGVYEDEQRLKKWLYSGITLSNIRCYPQEWIDNFFENYWRYIPSQLKAVDRNKLYDVKTTMVEKTYKTYGLHRARWPDALRHNPMIPCYETDQVNYRISSASITSYGVFLLPELFEWTQESDNWLSILEYSRPYLLDDVYQMYRLKLSTQDLLMSKYTLGFLQEGSALHVENIDELNHLHF